MDSYDQAEFEAELKRRLLVDEAEVTDHAFPKLENLSAAFLFEFVVKPPTRLPPECVYVSRRPRSAFASRDDAFRYELAITDWNTLWQAGQVRYELLEQRLAPELRWLSAYRGQNITLVPFEKRGPRYQAYSALYHLLPPQTLRRFGLPLLRRGIWPYWLHDFWINKFLPPDFDERLSQAFAYHIWPYLGGVSTPRAFAADESIRLLAHNLDFWLPYADEVVYRRLETMMRPVRIESAEQRRKQQQLRSEVPREIRVSRPLTGGYVWCGVDEAHEATRELVELADAQGKLRALLDAIRSQRVEEDFSPLWSYAREDFERKLYRKRSKVKVSFVEIDKTTPVHAPTSEVHENLIWQDLLAVVSPRERRVVICLRNGTTRVGDIAKVLGYANHSPVSKALMRIREKARRLLRSAT